MKPTTNDYDDLIVSLRDEQVAAAVLEAAFAMSAGIEVPDEVAEHPLVTWLAAKIEQPPEVAAAAFEAMRQDRASPWVRDTVRGFQERAIDYCLERRLNAEAAAP